MKKFRIKYLCLNEIIHLNTYVFVRNEKTHLKINPSHLSDSGIEIWFIFIKKMTVVGESFVLKKWHSTVDKILMPTDSY